MTFAINALF